jgi:Tfp pilus assembly protein PilN
MLNVNLLPWRDRQRRRKMKHLMLLSFLHCTFVIAVYSTISHIINENSRKFTETGRIWQQHNVLLSQNIARLASYQKKLTDQRDAQRERRLRKLQAENRLNLLTMIAAVLPETLWLSKVSARQHKITIEGFSFDYSSVVSLNERLKTFNPLKHTEIINIIQHNNIGQDLPPGLTFLLEATWN